MKSALVYVALAIFVSAGVRAQTSANDLVGTVPTLRVVTLGGDTFDLADKLGTWVVLNYWATWCGPCIKEIPELTALAKREDVDVLGLDFEEIERADLDAFLREHPAGYPIAPVDVYDPPPAFPVPRGLPMTYLIAPDGKVARAFVGPVTRTEIEKAIAAAPATTRDGQ